MRLPCHWLTELVKVPGDPASIAAALALRGFEVASVEQGRQPVIDFEITANRPDCLSIIGLAREASAAYGLPLQLPERGRPPAPDHVDEPQPIDVVIEDAQLCPRYCAQVFEVRSGGHTPDWMRDRLEACGVRSINPIVDVTNYVMLEMGQPTHAFDYARLGGRALRIRRAKPGETIRTLDGVERALQPDMLVIADAERAQAVGGVMGGASSEIGAATKLMVLESAYFKPASIRLTSKRLGLKTEASTRFERGADVEAAPAAIARAATLMQQIGAAAPLGPMIDRYPEPESPRTLTLRSARIERVLGLAVPDADVPRILAPLGFEVRGRSSTPDARPSWDVIVPSFRVDVLREIDLIEEIARHDGYVGLPATFPALDAAQPPPDSRTVRDRQLRQLLTACGLSEAMTFAFIEEAAAAPFLSAAPSASAAVPSARSASSAPSAAVPSASSASSAAVPSASSASSAAVLSAAAAVRVANPLSEKFAVLRPSLLPGLVDAASHNRRHGHADIRLFETGTRFRSSGETRAVAGVWCGAGAPPHWSGATRPSDFYDVKGVVEAVGRAFGLALEFEPAEVEYLVAGRTSAVRSSLNAAAGEGNSRGLGLIGQIQPAILDARGFPSGETLWAFELEADALPVETGDLRAESLPRFPAIVRDLSVLVDAALPAASVRGTIRSSAPSTLVHAIEFDRYRGKGIPEGRVSLSLRLTFRSPERTLTDGEVDEAMETIVAALGQAHGATRR